MPERLAVLTQYLLPKQALTRFGGLIAGARAGRFTTALIRWFVGKYQVDMREAADSDIGHYASFNDFFTRALKPGMRPLAPAALVSPVDGAVSQCGSIQGDQIFQAKGHRYSTAALVGGDRELAKAFADGH
ncbi:MAG: phosphatidylserine decarboxylase, partial [Ideonella sp.]